MRPETERTLGAINRAFYRSEANAFSSTRAAPWAGWTALLERIGERARVLDLGCGNGRFGEALLSSRADLRAYVGLDASQQLLDEARSRLSGRCDEARFVRFDLLEEPFDALPEGPFDLVACFGLMHHLPGRERRLRLLRSLSGRLAGGGILAVAVWRFAGRDRFERRRVPFRDLPRYGFPAIEEADLELGDALLRWGETRVRYCHQVDDEEIAAWLGALSGLALVARYRADGREGDLNDYLVLEAPGG